MFSNAADRWGLPPVRGHWPLVWAMVIDTVGTGLFLPFTILYFLATTRLPVAEIGLALAVAGFASLPLGPICGSLADRYGARSVVVASNLLRAVGFVAFLGVRSFPELIIAAFVVQAGNRAFYSSYAPLVTQVAAAGQRERWFGFIGAVRNVGFALGGVVAGVAITGAGVAGYRAVVIINAASFAFAAVLLLTLKVRPLPTHDDPRAVPGGWRDVLADRPYLGLTAINTAFALATYALDILLPVYLVHVLALPAWTAGASFGLNCILVAFGQGPVVAILEGRSRPRLLAISGGLSAASALVFLGADPLPAAGALTLVAIGVILFSAAELIQSPVMSALSSEAAPDALRGRYIALFQVSWTISGAAGTAVLTGLLSVGPPAAWGFLAFISLTGSAGISIFGRRLRTERPEPAETTAPPSSTSVGAAARGRDPGP
jgi:MFS family permease